MEFGTLLVVALLFAWGAKVRSQAQRIGRLGRALGQFRIEKHLETLTEGYLRALGESDPQRGEQIFALLRPTEQALAGEFDRFVEAFAREEGPPPRVSRLPVDLPFANQLPATSFPLLAALAIHARGIRSAIGVGDSTPARARAHTILAELLLMQHTCHWYCRSRLVASARLLARHQTSYEQAVGAVGARTREAYLALVH